MVPIAILAHRTHPNCHYSYALVIESFVVFYVSSVYEPVKVLVMPDSWRSNLTFLVHNTVYKGHHQVTVSWLRNRAQAHICHYLVSVGLVSPQQI